MAARASTKRGMRSTSRKMASSRYGTDPMPATQAVPGAFGQGDRKTPKSAGPLRPHPAGPGTGPASGPVGISNRPLGREKTEQEHVPPRQKAKGR
jgi:hypothetical protein